MTKINYIFIIILSFSSYSIKAQIFDNEQANSNINWKQIDTEKFRLIFPSEFTPRINRIANTIQQQLDQANQELTRKTKKISLIIQSNTLEQNGYVQLAPRKSELYSTPSSIADNQAWLTNLSLHEVRHVAQFDNLTGRIHKPFGEQLALALFAINLPSWYYEGDAVLHETLFSEGGRGRLASWQMPVRANIQSNRNYDFNKYVHGSFKDIVPSYYTIGYFMNSQLFENNQTITSSVYSKMRRNILSPFNFQHALKKYSNTKASELFQETMQNLKKTWGKKNENIHTNRIEIKDKYPTDYTLPQVVNKKIFTIQKNAQRVNRIVEIEPYNNNKITEVIKTGTQLMPYFDIQEHLITWDEYQRNPRFGKETYNSIHVFDIKKKKKTTIAKKVRYYTPIISPDLTKITCIEVDKANKSYLTTIDIANKEIISRIEISDDVHIQQPQYNANGSKVITNAISELGTSLMEIDLQNKQTKLLYPWTNIQFERPSYYDKAIVFKANVNNKDDIFIWDNNITYRLTDSEFGAFNPSVHEHTLYFNDYTPQGLHINHEKINLENLQITELEPSRTLYSSQNNFQLPESIETSNIYKIEDYNTLKHAINVHSISISGSDFESFENIKPGIFLLSNDVLNTTRAQLGFEYDTNIKKTTYSAELSYQKYYPRITIGYKNRGQIGWAKVDSQADAVRQFDYRENVLTADIQIPLIQYNGNYIHSYGFNFGTSYQSRYNLSLSNLKNFNYEIRFPLNYQVYFSRNTRRSQMDIFPRWGQGFSFTYRHLPFEKELNGTALSLRTSFYFPGLALNHGLQIRYSMQKNNGRFLGSNHIPLISGITYMPYELFKNTLLIDYRLPITYPDWSLGQLTYLKRIYGGISANYMNIHHYSSIKPPVISGSLFFDFNVFKYNLPNFLLETKLNYITTKYAKKSLYPELSFSYNY